MTKSILGVALIGAVVVVPVQAQAPAQLVGFLRQGIGLDSAQLALVERGEGVVKVLDTKDRRDVALFGIITSPASRDAYLGQVRDFRNSLRTPTRTHFGIFSDPASAADVEAVTVSMRDVEDMKDCRPGNCVVKLHGLPGARRFGDGDLRRSRQSQRALERGVRRVTCGVALRL